RSNLWYTMKWNAATRLGIHNMVKRKQPAMTRPRNVLLLAALLSFVCSGQTPKPAEPGQDNAKADAYYNFAMGHLYAELAEAYGNRSDYLTKAIDHYKAALRKDPGAAFLAEELTDLYIQ